MSFNAKYPGSCDDCGDDIAPGDLVAYVGAGELVHATCPTPEQRAAKVCPSCNMALPLTGVCDDCA